MRALPHLALSAGWLTHATALAKVLLDAKADPNLTSEHDASEHDAENHSERFTALQVVCLAVLWALKLSPSTALIFPSVIGVLMFVRAKVIPRIFSIRELMLLDTAIGATSA